MDNKQIPPSGPLTESDSYSPSAIYFDGTYMDGNQTWHAEDSPWKAKQIARILRRNKLNPASVCEVGCGAGEILVQLSSSFADTTFVGYERSPQAMAMCQSKETPKVSYRMRDIFEDPEVFDCLLCIDVFEHVDDYMGFLRKLRTKSRYKVFHIPLDVSVFSVLNSSMLHARQSVGHLHYFTRETAIATLIDCGYTIVDGFFTAPFAGLAVKSLKSRIAKIPRKALFSISPAIAARTLGACAYLVLAE